jgi:hypothetical protein
VNTPRLNTTKANELGVTCESFKAETWRDSTCMLLLLLLLQRACLAGPIKQWSIVRHN